MISRMNLRALVNDRLTAAADEIFALFERTIVDYEDQLRLYKEQNQAQQKLLDSVLILPPTAVKVVTDNIQIPAMRSARDVLKEVIKVNKDVIKVDKDVVKVNTEVIKVNKDANKEINQDIKVEPVKLPLNEDQQIEVLRVTVKREEEAVALDSLHPEEEEGGEEEEEEEDEEQGYTSEDNEEWEALNSNWSEMPKEMEVINEDHCYQDNIADTDPQPGCSSSQSVEEMDISILKNKIPPRPPGYVSPQREFQCTLCEKSCETKWELTIHERVHTVHLRLKAEAEPEDKVLNCPFCLKTFTQNCRLQSHLKVHTGDKPFSCSFCKKRFSHNSSVTVHERIHTGEKPHSCPICGKAFADSSTLRKHLRSKYHNNLRLKTVYKS